MLIRIKQREESRGELTEIQELLHGQRRRRELGEVLDVFGHVGQRRGLHQRAHELHPTRHPPQVSSQRAIKSALVAGNSACLRLRWTLSLNRRSGPMGARGGRSPGAVPENPTYLFSRKMVNKERAGVTGSHVYVTFPRPDKQGHALRASPFPCCASMLT